MTEEETLTNEPESAKAAPEALENASADAADAPDAPENAHEAATSAYVPLKSAVEAAVEAEAAQSPAQKIPLGGWIAIAAAALVIGLLIGIFAFGGKAASSDLAGVTSVPDNKLDTVVASYTFGNQKQDISVREVLQSNGSLDMAKNDKGEYNVPGAAVVLQYAQNCILKSEAERRGITAADDEVASYAEKMIGSSDLASISSSYGMDEATLKNMVHDALVTEKLRDEVTGASSQSAEMPEQPPAPTMSADAQASGDSASAATDEPSKQYADYIIKLAGSEWDSSKGTWASTDSPYAVALAGYEVTADGATYEAAVQAYYVAYQAYSEATSGSQEAWTDFLNDLLSKSTITINTLLAS